jgi:ribonuclease HII
MTSSRGPIRRTRRRARGPTLFDDDPGSSEPPFPVRVVAGVDEAGLGPLLGPLSVGMSAFRVPCDTEIWDALTSSVARDVERARERFVVADSKVVFDRTPSGARRLESTVLAFEALHNRRAQPCEHTRAFLESTPLTLRVESLAEEPWYPHLPARLSPECAGNALDARIDALRQCATAAGVEVVSMCVRAIPARELNSSFQETENKAATHWEACAPFLTMLWERYGTEGLELVVDRHGGRMYYAALLKVTFPRARVRIVREEPAVSQYTLRDDEGRAMRLAFAERGETFSFAVALASCCAKYAREACMGAFNAYFAGFQPDLRATAGYRNDAWRWLEEAQEAIQRSGVPRRAIVRER